MDDRIRPNFFEHGLGYKKYYDVVFLVEIPANSEVITINIYDNLFLTDREFEYFPDREVSFNFLNTHDGGKKYISLRYKFSPVVLKVINENTGETYTHAYTTELRFIIRILKNFDISPPVMSGVSAKYKYQLVFRMYLCRWFDWNFQLEDKLEKYVKNNFSKLMTEAIVRDNYELVREVAEKTDLLTRRNIKKYIEFAENFGRDDIYFLLEEMNF